MTDSKGNELQIGDVVATQPIRILVAKMDGKHIWLGRDGWENRKMPGESDEDMLVKLTQEEMTKSFWSKQNGAAQPTQTR